MSARNSQVGCCAVAVTVFVLMMQLAAPALATETHASLAEALKGGKLSLNLRYRFESVDDDAFADNGYASTLRTALGYATAPWRGLSAKVEFQSVVDVGAADKHNNKGAGTAWNGVSDRPVIADPDQTDINQAYLDWRVADGTHFRFGRQEILLDNVRFVGNVGWRQFHQSFDAVELVTHALPKTTLTYAYVYNQNRIFSDTKEMGSHLLNLGWDLGRAGRLTAYGYLIDYDKLSDSGLSTMTYGVGWHGGVALSTSVTGLYDFEIAQQNDAGDNPAHVDAGYHRVSVGAGLGIWTFKAGYEVLEGAPGKGAFSTPLATLHAWNGWADKFLQTPANGLEDVSLSVAAKISTWKLAAIYHSFDANTGNASYGSEIDLLAAWTSPWKQVFAVKAAAYDADHYSTDSTKLWAFTSWNF